jgi:hypothetical protein
MLPCPPDRDGTAEAKESASPGSPRVSDLDAMGIYHVRLGKTHSRSPKEGWTVIN